MKLAANISLLYGNRSTQEQLSAAAADGFRHIEMLAPYDITPEKLASALSDHGMKLVLINTPAGGVDHPMGVAAHPDQGALFREGMEQAAAVCRATGCRRVHVLAGYRLADYTYQQQIDTLHYNLQWAHTQFPELCFDLEALNQSDVPNYLYADPRQIVELLDAWSGLPVGLQFDFYHVIKQGLSLRDRLTECFGHVVHVQVAGAPDRNEPDLAKDHIDAGFAYLHEAGYRGFVGLEYRPGQGCARNGMGWLQPLVQRQWVQF